MSIGVGTYSDGFGVAFTLLDQFSTIAAKIEASMASLTGATTGFVNKNNAALAKMTWKGDAASIEMYENMEIAQIAQAASDSRLMANKMENHRLHNSLQRQQMVLDREMQAEAEAVAAQQLILDQAQAASDTRLLNTRMVNHRLYNSIQREQMILDREAAAEAVAAAEAQTAALAARNLSLLQLGASIAGLALIVKGAHVDAEFEKAELTIEGFIGSAKRAHEFFNKIQQDTNNNPFMAMGERLKAFDLLLSQGIDETVSERVTNNLSNLLTSVGRGAPELRRVSRELEKIAANGKLTGRELYQAAAAGIPLRSILEDYFGHKLPESLKELPISIQDLDGALNKAMANGGRYSKAMDKILESSIAKWAQMTNYEIPLMFAAIGQAVEPLTKLLIGALSTVFEFLRVFSASWIGQAFWMITTSLLVLSGVMGLATLSGKAFSWVLTRVAHGLGHATIAALKTTIANEGLATSFLRLGTAIMSSPLFWWFAGIAAAAALATSAVRHFTKVMNGEEAIADVGTMSGQLQRLGGMLKFAKEAFMSYDTTLRKSNVSQEMVTALDALGLHGITANIEGLIGMMYDFAGGIMSVFSGIGSFLYNVGAGIAFIVVGAVDLITMLLSLIGVQTTLTDKVHAWVWIGRLAGVIMLGLAAKSLYLGIRTLWLGETATWMGVKYYLASMRVWAASLTMVEGIALVSAAIGGILILWALFALGAHSSTDKATDSIDNMNDSLTQTVKAITDVDIAAQKMQAHINKLTTLGNIRAHISYEQTHNPGGDDLKYWMKQEDKTMGDIRADAPYITSPDAFSLQESQRKAASDSLMQQVDNEAWGGNWGKKKTANVDNRTINATLVLDGKVLATVLLPYQNEITRRNNATANA